MLTTRSIINKIRDQPFPTRCNLSQRTRKPHHVYNSVTLIISQQTKYITPAGCYRHIIFFQPLGVFFFCAPLAPPLPLLKVPTYPLLPYPARPLYITPPQASTPFQSVFVFACSPSPPHLPFLAPLCLHWSAVPWGPPHRRHQDWSSPWLSLASARPLAQVIVATTLLARFSKKYMTRTAF